MPVEQLNRDQQTKPTKKQKYKADDLETKENCQDNIFELGRGDRIACRGESLLGAQTVHLHSQGRKQRVWAQVQLGVPRAGSSSLKYNFLIKQGHQWRVRMREEVWRVEETGECHLGRWESEQTGEM